MFSDEWIRELDYQRPPIPSSNTDIHISALKPLDFREYPPVRRTETRYHDLSSDIQGRILTDINQELIDHEINNMVTEFTGQTLTNKVLIILRCFFLSLGCPIFLVTQCSEYERCDK